MVVNQIDKIMLSLTRLRWNILQEVAERSELLIKRVNCLLPGMKTWLIQIELYQNLYFTVLSDTIDYVLCVNLQCAIRRHKNISVSTYRIQIVPSKQYHCFCEQYRIIFRAVYEIIKKCVYCTMAIEA